MALTQEDRESYALIINKIYEGNMHVESYEITESVAEEVEKMCSDIIKCSQSIAELGFSVIYTLTVSPLIPGLLAKLGGAAAKEILRDWIVALFGNRQSLFCVNPAKANYRSSIYYALYL